MIDSLLILKIAKRRIDESEKFGPELDNILKDMKRIARGIPYMESRAKWFNDRKCYKKIISRTCRFDKLECKLKEYLAKATNLQSEADRLMDLSKEIRILQNRHK